MKYLFLLSLLAAASANAQQRAAAALLESLQNSEWTQSCHKKGDYYMTVKMAFFARQESVHSWKWYKDPSCAGEPEGEFYDKWKSVSIKPSSLGPNIFEQDLILLDGYKHQCKKERGILYKKGGRLYFGDYYPGTDQQLSCGQRPTELQQTAFIFSSDISQSAEEYTKTLKRRY